MNDVSSLGRIIVIVGVAIVIFGLIMMLLARMTGGRGNPLPGDIVIHWNGATIYFPIVTMLVISVILTLLFWLFAALRR